MPIPASWNTVPVTWTLIGQDGTPCQGRVRFSAELTVAAEGVSVVPEPIWATVVDGVMSAVSLPATDDPDINPQSWMWKVEAQTAPAGPRPFYLPVPLAGGTINLANAVPLRVPSFPQLVPTGTISTVDGGTP